MSRLFDYINKTKKTDIIFDFDKTLFKVLLDWDNYFGDILNDLLKIDRNLFLDYESGKINWCEMQNLYVERHGLSVWNLIRSNNIKSDLTLLKGYLPNWELIDFIRNLKNGCHLYIWSSNTMELVKKILLEERLFYKFEKIICSNDVYFLKPKIDGFLKIRDSTVPLKNYLMVGDSKNDKNAAISCDIDFYKVNFFE